MTLDEIARLAGVSRTTASYVINGKADRYRISQKTRDKVMAVVEEHNYQPDHAATSLRMGSSHSLGLVIPDLENASYARIAKLLERHARQAGFQLIISCSDDDPDTEISVATLLLGRRIDALIVASSLPAEHRFYRDIQEKGTPVIAIDRAMDDEHFASVISEDLEGSFQLTSKLLDAKPESIGLIGAVPKLVVSREREQGFRSATEKSSADTRIVYGEHFSHEAGRRLLQAWIDDDCVPDAILTTSFTLFEGVLDELRCHPELMNRIQLATFGDNRLLDFLPFVVHSLPQEFEQIAEKALSLTLSAIKGNHQSGIDVVPRKVKWREAAKH